MEWTDSQVGFLLNVGSEYSFDLIDYAICLQTLLIESYRMDNSCRGLVNVAR